MDLSQRSRVMRAVVAALCLGPAIAGALELGSARVNSTAGSALDIEIPLLEVAAGELDALKPALPANSRSAALSSASIEVGQGADGSPALRIRSVQPVSGNDLRFVVVADWGRGRRFREYVISLGGETPAAPAAVATAAPVQTAAESAAAAAVQEPPPSETTFSTTSSGAGLVTESVALPVAAAPAASGSPRRVRPGETLMSISRELAAATGATLAQAMVGIFRSNPQAFGKGGMSELLVNSDLVMPDAAALGVTSPRAASSEISRALGIWRTAGADGRNGTTESAAPGNAAAEQTLRTTPTSPAPAATPPVAKPPVVPSPSVVPKAPIGPAASVAPKAPGVPAATVAPKAAPLTLQSPAAATPAAKEASTAIPPAATTPTATAVAPAEPAAPDVAAKLATLESQLADKSADLEAALLETAALKSRLAAAESALAAAAKEDAGWIGKARHWAAAAWWSIPALAALCLMLLALLVLVVRAKGQRAKPAADPAGTDASGEAAPRREMTVELPPIRPKRDEALSTESLAADALMREPPPATPEPAPAPAPRRPPPAAAAPAPIAPPVLATPPADDLEGDPPPVDEASSKINLARAFIEMGDHDAAILELQAALRLGDERQRAEAIRLLDSLPKL